MNLAKLSSLLIAAFLLIMSYAACAMIFSKQAIKTDYGKMYHSTAFFYANKNIYTPVLVQVPDKKHPGKMLEKPHSANLNTPFFVVLTLPLGLLSSGSSYLVWIALSLLAGVASVLLISRTYRESISKGVALFVALVFFCYYPTFANVQYGQMGLFILLPVALAFVALEEGRDKQAGLYLGLAFAMKLFVGLFVLMFILQRQWRLLAWLFGSFLFCQAIAWVIVGWPAYEQYYEVLHDIHWYASSMNASLYGFLARIFGIGEGNVVLWDIPQMTSVVYLALAGLLLGGFWAMRGGLGVGAISFAYTIIAMLLISPLGWIYYFPLLLIPVAVIFKHSAQCREMTALRLLAAGALLLSSMPHTNIEPMAMAAGAPLLSWFAYPTYGLLVLGGLLWWLSTAPRVLQPANKPQGLNSALFAAALLPSFVFILSYTQRVVSATS